MSLESNAKSIEKFANQKLSRIEAATISAFLRDLIKEINELKEKINHLKDH